MLKVLCENIFLVSGDSIVKLDSESIKAFAWVTSITKRLISYRNCVELDAMSFVSVGSTG